MKHASPEALNRIGQLVDALSSLTALNEKKRGVYYLRGKAFLHFHEDPEGMFADVRFADDWSRVQVDSTAAQHRLLGMVIRHLPAK